VGRPLAPSAPLVERGDSFDPRLGLHWLTAPISWRLGTVRTRRPSPGVGSLGLPRPRLGFRSMPAASRMSPDPGLFATFRGLHTAIGGNIPKSGDVRSGPTEDNALYVGPTRRLARGGRSCDAPWT